MLPPNIKTVIKDKEKNITVRIMSYRKLKRFEIDSCFASLLRREKKLKKNHTYVIMTIFGASREF